MENDNVTTPRYGDVRATSARYGWGKTTTYKLLRSNSIRAVKIGNKRLIDFASVDEYLASLPSFGEAA